MRLKSIRKIADTCDSCGRLLSPADKAFYETLCGKCQWEANEIFREIVLPIMKSLKKPKKQ